MRLAGRRGVETQGGAGARAVGLQKRVSLTDHKECSLNTISKKWQVRGRKEESWEQVGRQGGAEGTNVSEVSKVEFFLPGDVSSKATGDCGMLNQAG